MTLDRRHVSKAKLHLIQLQLHALSRGKCVPNSVVRLVRNHQPIDLVALLCQVLSYLADVAKDLPDCLVA